MKHMELLTQVIGRISNTSFLIKGWAITLVVATIAFTGRGEDRTVLYVVFLPICVLWALDAYYLMIERGLRRRFVVVSRTAEPQVDFDMSPLYPKRPARAFLSCLLLAWAVTPFWLMLIASARLMVWVLLT